MISAEASVPAGQIEQSDEQDDRDAPVAQSPFQPGSKLEEQAPKEK
jgi:hypothetical protein